MTESDYRAINRAHWDDRAPAHAASRDYAVHRFAAEPDFLSDVVRFDLPRLGEVAGLAGVHLQCHIGTDTVSLARLGARMTGLDLSGASVAEARRVAALAGVEVTFVEGELYDAPDLLPHGAFDLVYTGVGALCWLPDIRRWAQVVATLLRPGGRVFLREGHPVLWALQDDRDDDLLVMTESYVEQVEPLPYESDGSYVEVDRPFTHNLSWSWNHGLGEIVTALFDAGLRLTSLVEHDSVPWVALPGHMEPVGGGEFALTRDRWRAPLSYTLTAVRE